MVTKASHPLANTVILSSIRTYPQPVSGHVSQQAVELVAILVFLLVAFSFDLYCLRDLAETDVTLYFPPRIWFYVIILSTPLGGISYLLVGRPR